MLRVLSSGQGVPEVKARGAGFSFSVLQLTMHRAGKECEPRQRVCHSWTRWTTDQRAFA